MTPETVNQAAWDRRAVRRERYVDTASEADFRQPLQVADPYGWLGSSIAGLKLLCLAAGGGRHGPLFASAGAEVTVVDLSAEMLAIDQRLARERGLHIRTVPATMSDLSSLGSATFDAVFHPVSTCYIARQGLRRVFDEVARVLKPRGLYLSFHKQPASLQAEGLPTESGRGYLVGTPIDHATALPAEQESALHRERGTMEFLHSWEGLVGGICRAGFAIEDLVEPKHGRIDSTPGSFPHRSAYLPPFFGIKARRDRHEASPAGGILISSLSSAHP